MLRRLFKEARAAGGQASEKSLIDNALASGETGSHDASPPCAADAAARKRKGKR